MLVITVACGDGCGGSVRFSSDQGRDAPAAFFGVCDRCGATFRLHGGTLQRVAAPFDPLKR